MDMKQIGIDIRTAIKKGETTKAISLIGTKKSILEMMTPFGTWLHVAASFGNLELVKHLVNAGVDVNRKGGTFGGNALHDAADAGHLEIVQYLLTSDSELDVSEPERNPLFAAILSRHSDIVQFLIESCIDIKVAYTGEIMKNMDALAFARREGNAEAATALASKVKSRSKFKPAWRSDTVVSLARHIYESRDFSAMPILADALQDAGCHNAEILTHCRGKGPHVRGCWVVDLVLEKT